MPIPPKKPETWWRALTTRLTVLWSDKGMNTSVIRHPIKTFESLKKRGTSTMAMASLARSHVINGPVLNIVLLGIPFLIDLSITEGVRAIKYHDHKVKMKKQQKKADLRRAEKLIRLRLDQQKARI